MGSRKMRPGALVSGAASVCRVVMKKGVLEEPPIMLVYRPPPLRDTSPLPPFPLIRRRSIRTICQFAQSMLGRSYNRV